MKKIKNFFISLYDRLGIARDLLKFFWKRKIWWLIPLIVMLILFAFLLIFAQGAAVTPFIYTLF